MNSLWDAQVEPAQAQQDPMQQMFGQSPFMQPWMNRGMQVPFYQQPAFNPATQAETLIGDKATVHVEEAKVEENVNEQVKATSNSMIEVLSKSTNPKHRNSKFLKFLKKLAHGAYGIENEQLVKNPEKLVEFKALEGERLKEEEVRQAEEKKQQLDDRQKLFERMWSGEEEIDEEMCKSYRIEITCL